MSTWWSMAPRADLGMRSSDLPGRPFAVTNKGWYFLYRFLTAAGARSLHVMAQPEAFIPTRLAVHWGQCIGNASTGDWLLVGRFNGQSVVASGIVHASQATSLGDECELTDLASTPAYLWLLDIGQELSSTVSGYLMTGKPKKGNPMSVPLTKGAKLDVSSAVKDANGGLGKVRIALGWDARKGAGEEFDLDASVVACTDAGIAVPGGFAYFGQLSALGGAMVHQGDELTGATAGDDEQIIVDLAALPADAVDLRVYVTIFEAGKRGGQTFGQVDNAFVRLIDEATGTELCRFDLTEDTPAGTNVLQFAKLYLHNGNWQFKALAEGFTHEIDGVVAEHKIS